MKNIDLDSSSANMTKSSIIILAHYSGTSKFNGNRLYIFNFEPTMGVCLRQLGINPLNTLDENLRNRFLTFRIEDHEASMWSRDPRDGDSYFWRYRPKFMGDTATGCCSVNHVLLVCKGESDLSQI